MKVLMVFVDMLSGFRQNLCNPKAEENMVDQVLKKVGGSVFSNCYSPGPDTSRSNAAVWSGALPRVNGCNTRIKYPRYYLDGSIDNLWRMIDAKRMEKKLFVNDRRIKVGLLPPNAEDGAEIFGNRDLYSFLNNVKISENSFTYIDLGDFHRALGDYEYEPRYFKKCYSLIGNELNMIFERLQRDIFDMIIIYSDHGYMDNSYNVGSRNNRHILDRRRTQTYLQIYRKGEERLRIDSKLCSVTDIFPTLASFLDYKIMNEIDGIDLFSDCEHKWIIVEDHGEFSVDLSMPIVWWGIITSKSSVITNVYDEWFPKDIPEETKKKYRKLLSEYADEYDENTKQIRIRNMYGKVNVVKTYDTGEIRPQMNRSLLRRVKDKIYYLKNNLSSIKH